MWCPKKSSSLLGAYEPQPFPLWCPPSSRYRCWPILASVPATSLQLCDEDEKACPGQPLDGALGHAHVLWRPCCFTIWLFVWNGWDMSCDSIANNYLPMILQHIPAEMYAVWGFKKAIHIFDFSVSFTMPRKPENVGIALLQCGAPKAWVLRFTDFFANFLDRINTQHPWFPMHFHGCVRAVVCPLRLMPNVEWAHRPEQSSFSKIIHFEYAYAIARFWQ